MSGSIPPPDLRGPEDNVFEAILRLRQAFILAGLKPPEAIELSSWEEGMKVLHLARTRYTDRYRRSLFRRRDADEPITEIDISGITVRWPAKRWTRGTLTIEAD